MDDQAWRDSAEPLLAGVLDEASYPPATRVRTAAGTAHGAHHPEHAYYLGIDRILDT